MEKVLQQILERLDSLTKGQEAQGLELKALHAAVTRLEKGQGAIRKELQGVWQDIKKLDDRLQEQEEKTQALG